LWQGSIRWRSGCAARPERLMRATPARASGDSAVSQHGAYFVVARTRSIQANRFLEGVLLRRARDECVAVSAIAEGRRPYTRPLRRLCASVVAVRSSIASRSHCATDAQHIDDEPFGRRRRVDVSATDARATSCEAQSSPRSRTLRVRRSSFATTMRSIVPARIPS
jgi:hypothetical protein